jgi:hypothetical protein
MQGGNGRGMGGAWGSCGSMGWHRNIGGTPHDPTLQSTNYEQAVRGPR